MNSLADRVVLEVDVAEHPCFGVPRAWPAHRPTARRHRTLADERGLQTFDLKPVTSSRVKVTFKAIRKGTTNDDLYVGEVRFWN